jgi:hypothetical protein
MRPLRVFAALCALAFADLGLISRAEAHESSQEHCLALALYWEARAEGPHGMLAVASVVLNRVRHPQFPDTVCEVVKEGARARPASSRGGATARATSRPRPAPGGGRRPWRGRS